MELDQRSERIKELWNAGHSQLAVSRELKVEFPGITRNVVAGTVKRLRDSGIGMRMGEPGRCVDRPTRYLTVRQIAVGVPLKPAAIPVGNGRKARMLRIADLRDDECRYPVDEDGRFFCGHVIEQELSSYCPTHHKLCWVPIKPRHASRDCASPRSPASSSEHPSRHREADAYDLHPSPEARPSPLLASSDDELCFPSPDEPAPLDEHYTSDPAF